jgi:hypothetical protein
VLFPIQVTAVLASPQLARARKKWIRLLPPGTAVWVIDRREVIGERSEVRRKRESDM